LSCIHIIAPTTFSFHFLQGSTPNIFVGTAAFEIIVKKQIKRLEEPSLKCCQLVYDELIRILGQLLAKIVSEYERLGVTLALTWVILISSDGIQAVPTAEGQDERCRHQLLQDCDEPHDETGHRHGQVRQQILWSLPSVNSYLTKHDLSSMQACYVNTTHPDFINGHKAMAIVHDRMNANKPPPPAQDPKRALNNNKDLDVEIKKEEPSFFGSFWNKAQTVSGRPVTPVKKGAAIMEAVSTKILAEMCIGTDIYMYVVNSLPPSSVRNRV
jgi:hypothetical protein